jgi:transcriptional regulator with XRE-family HTH domain
MSTFSDYLEAKLLEWQNQQGKHKTLKEFAEYLEVGRPLLSMWLNGTRVPGPRYINRLAQKLGQDVYEILGTKPAPRFVNEVQATYETLKDTDERNEFERIIEDALKSFRDAKRIK